MNLLQKPKAQRAATTQARQARLAARKQPQPQRRGESSAKSPPPASPIRTPPSPPDDSTDEELHVGKRGDRYKLRQSVFDENAVDDRVRFGVVKREGRSGVEMWFDGDAKLTYYPDRLESWTQYFIPPDEYESEDEKAFQEVEVCCGLRKANAVPKPRKRVILESSSEDDSDADVGEEADELQEGYVVVDEWESDEEDDENEEAPDDMDAGCVYTNDDLDVSLAALKWADCGVLRTDPRVALSADPEMITPVFSMPNYREETLMNWFLYYFPLSLVADIVAATNSNAMTIAWPRTQPWKHLKVGEWLRWLGLWVLMTLCPVHGGRRQYWRGLLNFKTWLTECRFEAILRSFTLPQYTTDDEQWGGQGRKFYEGKKFDKFFETRKFTDTIRLRF